MCLPSIWQRSAWGSRFSLQGFVLKLTQLHEYSNSPPVSFLYFFIFIGGEERSVQITIIERWLDFLWGGHRNPSSATDLIRGFRQSNLSLAGVPGLWNKRARPQGHYCPPSSKILSPNTLTSVIWLRVPSDGHFENFTCWLCTRSFPSRMLTSQRGLQWAR